jgi:hypothetical protein
MKKAANCTPSTLSGTVNYCSGKFASGILKGWLPSGALAFMRSTAGSKLRIRLIRRGRGGRICSRHFTNVLHAHLDPRAKDGGSSMNVEKSCR